VYANALANDATNALGIVDGADDARAEGTVADCEQCSVSSVGTSGVV
jgi:hypothetical protein